MMDSHNNHHDSIGAGASPFALVVADGSVPVDDMALEAAFRRMGLRPMAGDHPTTMLLQFGALTLQARRADPATMAMASPDLDGTSLVSHALPDNWTSSGRCLAFAPSLDSGGDAQGSTRANALREFFKTMVLLIDLFDATHLYWSAARLWSDARQFREAVAEMLVSGMPPILHLVAFLGEDGGAGLVVRTRGLAHFARQELVADCPAGWTMQQVTKRLARVAIDMLLNGAMTHAQRYRGLEPGEWMALSPRPADENDMARVMVAFHFDAA